MPIHYFEFKESSNLEDMFISNHLKATVKGKKTLIVYFDLMRGFQKHKLPKSYEKKILLVEENQVLNCLAIVRQLAKVHKEQPIKAIYLEHFEMLCDDPLNEDPSVLRNVSFRHYREELIKNLGLLNIPVYITGIQKRNPTDPEGPRETFISGREFNMMSTLTSGLDGSLDLVSLIKEKDTSCLP